MYFAIFLGTCSQRLRLPPWVFGTEVMTVMQQTMDRSLRLPTFRASIAVAKSISQSYRVREVSLLAKALKIGSEMTFFLEAVKKANIKYVELMTSHAYRKFSRV